MWLAAELTADGGRLLSNSSGSGGATKEEAEQAVEGQIEALFSRTPRAGNDAISHRVEDVELWSDFVCALSFLFLSVLDEGELTLSVLFVDADMVPPVRFLHVSRPRLPMLTEIR